MAWEVPAFGSKFVDGMTVAAIAKAIRSDIRAAIAAGALPRDLVTSVRSKVYTTGGASIRVRIESAPVRVWSLAFVEFEMRTAHRVHFDGERQTDEARALVRTLRAIGNAYNWDRSDIQSDYFHSNYSLGVDFDHDFSQADRTRANAECAASMARPVHPANEPHPNTFPVSLYA